MTGPNPFGDPLGYLLARLDEAEGTLEERIVAVLGPVSDVELRALTWALRDPYENRHSHKRRGGEATPGALSED